MEIVLTTSKPSVMGEVAQATAYMGGKAVDDDTAYERISTVDEDVSELDVFFDEGRTKLTEAFTRHVTQEGMEEDGETYALGLRVTDKFNLALMPSLNLSLFNFMVHWILFRWYEYTKPELAEQEFLKCQGYMDMLKKQSNYTNVFERKISTF